MNTIQYKTVKLELKDLSVGKREAVIAHSVYGTLDRVGDIVERGAFAKSWKENKKIDFLFNHDQEQIVGSVLRTFDDENKAYSHVKFGDWTLGNDVLEQAAAGVLRGASFGYVAEKKEFVQINGKRVRRLKEIRHFETSLLSRLPAHPDAGIVTLNKSAERDGRILDLRDHIERMERFYRNARASDECLQRVHSDIAEAKSILSGLVYEDADEQDFATELHRLADQQFSNSQFISGLKKISSII
ncbi:MAG: HK97 family phage prohead protease [Flavisolibacter sp.]